MIFLGRKSFFFEMASESQIKPYIKNRICGTREELLIMNKPEKNWMVVAILLCILVIFTGCKGAKYDGLDETTGNLLESSSSFEGTCEESSIIEEPPADWKPAVYWAEPLHFSEEAINAFIEANGDSIVLAQEDVSTHYITYSGTTKNGSQFIRHENVEGHPYRVFQYWNEEKDKYYNSYNIYSGEETYNTISQYNNIGQMFTQKRDFSFASANQAEQTVRNLLESLGLSDLVLVRTLYLDHKTMAKVGDILSTDEQSASIKGDTSENNDYPLKENWSEADDCYQFCFLINVSCVPLSYRFIIRDTGTYCGSEVLVRFSKDGIINLSVSTPWLVGNIAYTTTESISAREVFEKAKEKLEHVLTYQDLVFEKVNLEYQYCQNKDSWQLRPIWVVTASHKMEYIEGRSFEYVYIDALTGKEL